MSQRRVLQMVSGDSWDTDDAATYPKGLQGNGVYTPFTLFNDDTNVSPFRAALMSSNVIMTTATMLGRRVIQYRLNTNCPNGEYGGLRISNDVFKMLTDAERAAGGVIQIGFRLITGNISDGYLSYNTMNASPWTSTCYLNAEANKEYWFDVIMHVGTDGADVYCNGSLVYSNSYCGTNGTNIGSYFSSSVSYSSALLRKAGDSLGITDYFMIYNPDLAAKPIGSTRINRAVITSTIPGVDGGSLVTAMNRKSGPYDVKEPSFNIPPGIGAVLKFNKPTIPAEITGCVLHTSTFRDGSSVANVLVDANNGNQTVISPVPYDSFRPTKETYVEITRDNNNAGLTNTDQLDKLDITVKSI